MTDVAALPDLLQPRREVVGDEVVYRYAGGLTIRTEVLHKDDTARILPLGSPQHALMNHLRAYPERVRDRRVFEPFAGSGALGLLALAEGAQQVTFLDVNPRAATFHRANAAASGLPADRVRSVTADIASWTPEQPFDLILANPPFVPTPDGIEGTLTSNGGPEGSRFLEILLDRLDVLLAPEGSALVYVYQLVSGGVGRRRPLIVERLERLGRPVALTATQRNAVPLEACARAYDRLFPAASDATARWQAALQRQHGDDLALCHYVLDIAPRGAGPAGCRLDDDFDAKFGAVFRVPSDDVEELAFGRVFENFVPGRDG